MKIQLEKNNKIFVFLGSEKKELHPIWLRERVSEKEHLDANTEQRLFDPSFLKNITIKEVNIDNDLEESINALNRQFLHAKTIGFNHPKSNARLEFTSKLPSDLEQILKKLRKIK